jgi:hypothetical protein
MHAETIKFNSFSGTDLEEYTSYEETTLRPVLDNLINQAKNEIEDIKKPQKPFAVVRATRMLGVAAALLEKHKKIPPKIIETTVYKKEVFQELTKELKWFASFYQGDRREVVKGVLLLPWQALFLVGSPLTMIFDLATYPAHKTYEEKVTTIEEKDFSWTESYIKEIAVLITDLMKITETRVEPSNIRIRHFNYEISAKDPQVLSSYTRFLRLFQHMPGEVSLLDDCKCQLVNVEKNTIESYLDSLARVNLSECLEVLTVQKSWEDYVATTLGGGSEDPAGFIDPRSFSVNFEINDNAGVKTLKVHASVDAWVSRDQLRLLKELKPQGASTTAEAESFEFISK